MEFRACILDNGSYVYAIVTSTPPLIRPEEQTELQEQVTCGQIEKTFAVASKNIRKRRVIFLHYSFLTSKTQTWRPYVH